MARRVVIVCDRCAVEFAPGGPGHEGPDLNVQFCGYAVTFEDLCDGCRTTVAGYVALILKRDREAVAGAVKANDGGPLPPPPKRTRDAEHVEEAPPEPPAPARQLTLATEDDTKPPPPANETRVLL